MAEHTVFYGTMLAMNRWMGENRINPNQAGRTIHLATNGPEQLRGVVGPVRIVHDRGWVPATTDAAWWADQTLHAAAAINGALVPPQNPEVIYL